VLTAFQRGFLGKIISVPSVGGKPEEKAPYGKKAREVLELFLAEADNQGFRTGIVGDRAGWVEFGTGKKLIGIICHLDVVPVSDGWNSNPFTLTFAEEETDGEVMCARGIVDDKGPACASFFAMKELCDAGRIPENCRVRLILGTDEERTCSCIQYYAAHGEIPDFAITPDSVFPVIYSEKRILQLKVYGKNQNGLKASGGSAVNIVPNSAGCIINGKEFSAAGRAAHASKPELGINAIILMAEAMEKDGINLEDYPVIKFAKDLHEAVLKEIQAEDESGKLTLNVGTLKADQEGCEVRIDFRVPASMDCNDLINKIEKMASGYGLETEVTLNLAPLLKDRNSPEVRVLSDIWERHMDQFTGFKEEYRKLHLQPKAVGVGTYARHIPNTIAFGIQAPWQTDQCHQANEHVTVNDFMQWTAIIKEYIEAFCKLICVNESD
jgi:succinyl-diaminopimelate desuccinylase